MNDEWNMMALSLRDVLGQLAIDRDKLQEVRLRIGKPLLVLYDGNEYGVTSDGRLTSNERNAYHVSDREIRETMEYISNYSLYAFEDELRQGFITIQGGHRVGVVGKTILEKGSVKVLRYVSSINMRLSHQVTGCGEKYLPYIMDGDSVRNTLIVSPPGCGKTTLLRDLIRIISDGGKTVGVVDERSELGACYLGIPQNDLGLRTDILDCCPKAEGMVMLLRSMAPQVIAIDEIGLKEDVTALHYVQNCGCKLLATVHGEDMEDVRMRPIIGELVRCKMFERYLVMGKEFIGQVVHIFDERGCVLF